MKKLDVRRLVKIMGIMVIPIIVVGIVLYKVNVYDKDIDVILKTDAYSYLSPAGQDYVRKVYEESGTLILTEKNKKENVPYLNPLYVEYLDLSDEEKESVDLLPDTYIIDYFVDDDYEDVELPSKYDLRDVDGKSYLTPMKDQGSLGVCWAFASIENAETYLMLKNNKSYTKDETQEFSVRQMDYATSVDGIKNYHNENGYRKLTSGGNYYMSSIIMANGLSLIDDNYMSYNEEANIKDLSDVLNYKNSNYEVDSTIMMPELSDTSSNKDIDNYVKEVKKLILEYGGAYVGTYSPQSGCGTLNTDGTYTIKTDSCRSMSGTYDKGHALQMVGWDDNYEYAYCNYTGTHKNTDNGKCTSEKALKTGKGAWILKNSWGTSSNAYQYVYLTYDSIGTSIGFITSLSDMEERSWDNNYHENPWDSNKGYYKTDDEQTFTKKINTSEKLEKVKFMAESINGEYTISIVSGDSNYKSFKTIKTLYPGINTFDFSQDNIIFDKSNFTISIKGNNDSYLDSDTISVFTSNVDKEPLIDLNKYNNYVISEQEMSLYAYTKNIPSNSHIEYKLYDEMGSDISSYISYKDNIVAENNVNTIISFSDISSLTSGTYRLDAIYDSKVLSSINLNYEKMNGIGTKDNPYIITNSIQLDKIRDNLDAYYELGNDIDLTEDTRDGGRFCNNDYTINALSCKGWEPIVGFSGSFDGKGYKIKGLYQQSYSKGDYGVTYYEEVSGLFGTATGSVSIKNLVLEDFDVSCNIVVTKYIDGYNRTNHCAALLGEYEYKDSINAYNVNFENISLINSKITGMPVDGSFWKGYRFETPNSVSGLVGNIEGKKGNLNISGIYIDSTIKAEKESSYLVNDIRGFDNININDIQLIGNYDVKDFVESGRYNSVISNNISCDNEECLKINNVLSTIHNDEVGYYFIDFIASGELNNINMLKIPNRSFFGVTNPVILSDITLNNVNTYDINTDIVELTKKSNYSTWEGFDDNFVMKTVDGIPRMPVLKFVDFEYTKIDDINYTKVLNEKKSIYDYITPNTSAARRIIYKSNDESIVKLDDNGTILPQKSGKTTIHIESLYDGYIKDVPVKVEYKPYYKVNFDANGGTGTMDSIEVSTSDNYDLPLCSFTNDDEHYRFNGWNTKADGTGKNYADLGVLEKLGDKEEITLYAQWIGEEFTVIFDADGGTVLPANKNVRYGEIYGELPIPIKNGYGFQYWRAMNESGSGYIVHEQSEVLLYPILKAKWIDNAYTIVFDANGGSGYLEHTYANFNSDKTLTSNTYTRDGYTFKGWNTSSDGKGTSYSDKEVINLSSVENSLLTLYAQWKKDIQSITNSTADYEGIYDGKEHTIDIDVDIDDYDIVYSTDGVNYNIDNIPKYKDVGEYKIYYKITKDGYEDLTNSNYVKIYGIKKIDDSIKVKDNTLVIKNNNDFDTLVSKIDVYATNKVFNHLNKNGLDVGNLEKIKTGDTIKININSSKDFNYTIAYLGDLNGDGNIDIGDLSKLYNYYRGNINIDGVYYIASDLNGDDSVNIGDLSKLYNYYRKNISSL